jgi:transcriptional regulator with PAS, ATPase and Fis domain
VAIPTFRVSVVDGPDRGKSVLVGPQSATRVFVGTSAACELALTDREVSRRHLALELEGASLRVTDLGSTNGTTIEGVSIASARLRGGERIVVGATSLRADLVEQGTAVRFPPVESFGQVLGKSVAMRRLYPVFQKLAASDVPVLVEGETGTGKELLAEAIHDMGPRKGKPFVVFDWQAVDPKRVESVLFGEQDRSKRRPGVFEEAAGGTVLIDEIAEMPLVLQAKLLRVLERSEVMPVGASAWIPVQARVIAVTARDLERAVEHESFREDLFYRLVVGRVSLPPLRHREGNVPLLAEHF